MRKAMRDAVDRMHPARGRTVVREAEHADHAVHVHEKNRNL
jgi:hypothetical protein